MAPFGTRYTRKTSQTKPLLSKPDTLAFIYCMSVEQCFSEPSWLCTPECKKNNRHIASCIGNPCSVHKKWARTKVVSQAFSLEFCLTIVSYHPRTSRYLDRRFSQQFEVPQLLEIGSAFLLSFLNFDILWWN